MPILDETRHPRDNSLPLSSDEQRLRRMQANLDKAKKDAAAMATLAKALREDLDKPNARALSPDVLDRIEKIEKLARRIRVETMGY
jgi:hypothetical protein